jgi:hypothetical protein
LKKEIVHLDKIENQNLNVQKLYETDCKVAQKKNKQLEKEIKKKKIIDI